MTGPWAAAAVGLPALARRSLPQPQFFRGSCPEDPLHLQRWLLPACAPHRGASHRRGSRRRGEDGLRLVQHQGSSAAGGIGGQAEGGGDGHGPHRDDAPRERLRVALCGFVLRRCLSMAPDGLVTLPANVPSALNLVRSRVRCAPWLVPAPIAARMPDPTSYAALAVGGQPLPES